MLIRNLAVVACLVSTAMAQQVNNIFCQARYITNVATCVIGVRECNTVERFSSCVCENSGNKPALRLCLVALLADPSFRSILKTSDFKSTADYDEKAEMAESGASGTPADK